jgi:phosphate transport system substrate-binding protein
MNRSWVFQKSVRVAARCVLPVLITCTSAVSAAAANNAAREIHGAGSTFVQPIITEWAYNWSQKTGNKVSYEGGGSGAGITKVKSGEANFGATDAPLSEEELNANGLIQFPVVAGGIVVIENVTNLSLGRRRLQVNGPLLAAIYMGKITRWNNPELVALNPGATLPDAPISVVHRSEGSGTTYNFSAYLTKASPEWAATLGTAKSINWPVGAGTEGNQNVANMVLNTPNSIGYVEYGYALAHNMRIATLHTADGFPFFPSQTTIRNALEAADWEHSSNFNLLLVGQQGKDSWPIAAVTWILLPVKDPSAQKSLELFRWALESGSELADAQGYTPLPPKLVKLIEASWVKTFPDARFAAPAH